MNANALARNYALLTPEERFRLTLAASGRGDDAERDRLASAAPRVGLSVPDHMPFAEAFAELSTVVFIELAEDAARYNDALGHASDAEEFFGEDEADDAGGGGGPDREDRTGPAGDARERPLAARMADLAMFAGYVLRTKAEGWRLFCERLGVPPFLLWEGLPGRDRLERFLSLAEKGAFTEGGCLRWWNRVRPAGAPEAGALPLTAEGMADAAEAIFRDRAEWWVA